MSGVATAKVSSNADNIYYNVNIPYSGNILGGEATPAEFFETRTEPLLGGRASDYSMSIIRFKVPTCQIPVQIVPILPQPNVDVNKTTYSITLSWNGFDRQVYLVWDTEDLTANIPPATLTDKTINTQYYQYYSMYSLTHFTNMINRAFETAFSQLVIDGAPITSPPVIGYDGASGLFTIYANTAYDSSVATPIEIYFNTALYNNFYTTFHDIFKGFNAPDGKNNQIIFREEADNLTTLPAPYGSCITNKQEYEGLANIVSFSSIVITSSALPVRSEWTSGQISNSNSNAPANSSFSKIITDAEIDISIGNESRSTITYLPTAEYRRLTLESDADIHNIDVRILWKDKYANLYPLLIPSNREASLKILFERKDYCA